VASSWFLFFSYRNDARSDKHQIVKSCLRLERNLVPLCLGINIPLFWDYLLLKKDGIWYSETSVTFRH